VSWGVHSRVALAVWSSPPSLLGEGRVECMISVTRVRARWDITAGAARAWTNVDDRKH